MSLCSLPSENIRDSHNYAPELNWLFNKQVNYQATRLCFYLLRSTKTASQQLKCSNTSQHGTINANVMVRFEHGVALQLYLRTSGIELNRWNSNTRFPFFRA